jgi:hypothetical protein
MTLVEILDAIMIYTDNIVVKTVKNAKMMEKGSVMQERT